MPEPSGSEVTQLFLAWSAGDQSALEKLSPLYHQELRRLAKASRERPGHSPGAAMGAADRSVDRAVGHGRSRRNRLAANGSNRLVASVAVGR